MKYLFMILLCAPFFAQADDSLNCLATGDGHLRNVQTGRECEIDIQISKFDRIMPIVVEGTLIPNTIGSYRFETADGRKMAIQCLRRPWSGGLLMIDLMSGDGERADDAQTMGRRHTESEEACDELLNQLLDGKFSHVRLSHQVKPDLFRNMFDHVEFSN